MDKKTRSFVLRILRQASLKHYARSEAFKRAYVRNDGRKHVVSCAKCEGEFYRKQVQADHVYPVVEVYDDNYTIDKYCERLFCGPEGYQILCIECHQEKTSIENSIRLEFDRKELTKDEASVKIKELLILSGFKFNDEPSKKTTTNPRVSKGCRTGRGSRLGIISTKSKRTKSTSKVSKKKCRKKCSTNKK